MPQPMTLPALSAPRGATPAARRRALLLETDDALAERLLVLAKALRTPGAASFAPLAAAVSLPIAEVVASPFAVRMVAMAAARGASTVHAELRRVIEWPKALRGDAATADPMHGVWDRGVLRLGKYQQFLQDEAFAAYHPDHVSKWGPHELMHRACGFFFRPGCTRWELYLGSRLNELLPVVTWYGPEQAMRLDEGAFDRVAAGRAPAARLEDARWLEEDARPLRARALRGATLLREGIEHVERELAAIDEEMATGRMVRVPHAFLDSSSDALAYVAGHAARLDRMGRSLAALVPTSLGRFEEIGAYRGFIEERFDALLFEALSFDAPRAHALREARTVWDVVHRGLQLGNRAAHKLAPDAGLAIAAATAGGSIDVAAWKTRLESALGRAAIENGDAARDTVSHDLLGDGVASCAPRTLEEAGDEIVPPFAGAPELWDRAPLAKRFARFLQRRRAAEHAVLASFEARIAAAQRGDDRVERLGEPASALPEALEGVMLARSTAFEVARFDRDVFALHAGEKPKRGARTYLIGAHRGEVAIVAVADLVIEALDALTAAPMSAADFVARLAPAPDPRAWLVELIEAGVIAWSPRLSPSPPAPRPARRTRARLRA